MRINIKVGLFKFNKGEFTKTIKHQIRQHILLGAKEFIETAAPLVPIQTGMARGSFLNLLALLNITHKNPNVDIPTTIQAKDSNGRYFKYRHNDTRELINKSPQNARKFSTARDQILTEVDGAWKFTYETRVTHFNAPENVRKWKSFELGRAAMRDKIKSLKLAYPRISSFVMSTTVDGGRQNPWKYVNPLNTKLEE